MPDLPLPTATRLRKPSWRDARLVVGLLLVLLSTVLGSMAIARADDRLPMYAASGPLLPGEQLSDANLVRVDVQLAGSGASYLSASGGVPPDMYVLREVRKGELVPLSALGSRSTVSVQPVTLMVDSTSASALVAGSVVDVYVNPPSRGSSASTDFQGPVRALEAVSVAGLAKERSGLGGNVNASLAVQVMVPTDRVQSLIGNIDRGAKVTLVPVPGSPRSEQ